MGALPLVPAILKATNPKFLSRNAPMTKACGVPAQGLASQTDRCHLLHTVEVIGIHGRESGPETDLT